MATTTNTWIVSLDFWCYAKRFRFTFPPTDYAQIRDGYLLVANPGCPLKYDKPNMPKLGPCPLPPNMRFIHVQRCGCKNGSCSFVTRVTEFSALKTVQDVWNVWKDPLHDHQIGKWFDRNDGSFLKLKPILEVPLVGPSCREPNNVSVPNIAIQASMNYIAFYYSPS